MKEQLEFKFNIKPEPKTLISTVKTDKYTEYISKAFDYNFTGVSFFKPHKKPKTPSEYNIGFIYGTSGSGKSTLLKEFGKTKEPIWDNNFAVISHFSSPESGANKLMSAGLSSIPTICKPYNVLSTGEKFRANIARQLKDNAVIDEYTSVVNREVAKSASVSISKYIRSNNLKNIVLCSCHKDIINYLEPDWTYCTDTQILSVGRSLWQRPKIKLEIFKTTWRDWDIFRNHHYLSSNINKCCTCFTAKLNNEKIGFVASMPLPGKIPPLYSGDIRKKYRESRLVILPDYQGLGVGMELSNFVAQYFFRQ